MEWISAIGGIWLTTLLWLAGLAVAFGILSRLMPCNPGTYWWKDLRAFGTDLIYWFIVPLFLRIFRTMMMAVAMALVFGDTDQRVLPVIHLPLWQQCVLILLIQDVIMYWIHRLFHCRLAWKFHAIHHSPKVLDWTATTRFHPINNLLEFALADIAVLLMGFSLEALLFLVPINLIYSTMVHANLNWTFGPLRYFFASPVFHRWHHTTLEEGINKNFAPTFPFLDVIFGTFHMPPGKLPEQFGTGEPDFPQGFWGQFFHPFRASATGQTDASTTVRGRPRRFAVAKITMSVLVVGILLAGGIYVRARLVRRHADRANSFPLSIDAPPAALPFDADARAWAESDEREITKVAISADGQRIASASKDGTVKVWDGARGRDLSILTGHEGPVSALALSEDGQVLVSGSYDRTLKVWQVETGQEKLTLRGHTGVILAAAISADGQSIVSGSADGSVKLWDTATGQEKATLVTQTGAIPSVAISADSRRIVWASWETAKLWDAQTGQETHVLKGHRDLVYCVAISPDGQRIVTGSLDGQAKVWDAETGHETRNLTGHVGSVLSVAISPDGTLLVSGSEDHSGKVWDLATGRMIRVLMGHADAVTCVASSAAGMRIVSSARDKKIKVWDAPERNPAPPSHPEPSHDPVTAQ
jgi:sterol desaturase/sphingolipid hydroxylase (fatty acid hydroxylase superfamily)